ncbi:hypothetical protein GCM10010347_62190 [Streptomyces cirratus]|uniref:Uncharacterized protein n=1 Tax=Streptomyces cirratus TaxID=68187 RepID=A0ABQ3F4L8_9ACTN|nr:hypothetical protein GCM10010347_62190 [Streptomyces cirratus]
MPAAAGPGERPGELARARTDARFAEIRYAVDAPEAGPGTDVYLDTGHAGRRTVNSIVPRLRDAGIDRATGFAVNVSSHHPDGANSWFAVLVSARLASTEAGTASRRTGAARPAGASEPAPPPPPVTGCTTPSRGSRPPGESDGACLRGTAGPRDPERGTVAPRPVLGSPNRHWNWPDRRIRPL